MPIKRIRLPHTGLQIPEKFPFRVTRLDQVDTVSGIAWSADLRFGSRRLGVIANDGRGSATLFHPETPSAAKAMRIFVEMCLDSDGEPLPDEFVYDLLVDEYEQADEVARAEARQRYSVRMFNQWDIPMLTELKNVPAGFPDYEAARRIAAVLEPPSEAVRGELWMGPDRGWVQVFVRLEDTTP